MTEYKVFSIDQLGKKRWIWAVWPSMWTLLEDYIGNARYGYTETEAEAQAIVAQMTGIPEVLSFDPGGKRKQMPRGWLGRGGARGIYRHFAKQRRKPNTGANGSTAVEYVYYTYYSDYDSELHWGERRIVKKTQKRVYVAVDNGRNDESTFVLDRAKLESTGEAWGGRFRRARDIYYTAEGKARFLAEREGWYKQAAPEYLVTLGLDSGATLTDIRRAYRRLAQKMHPDKGGDPAQFVRLKEAYEQAVQFTAK